MTLTVRDLTVRYEETTAVDRVSFEVRDGEVVALIGPSGSGKTSVLRAVAGLVTPAAGIVGWAGEDLGRVPPHRRDFSLMFQDHALLSGRSVAENVGFGLRMRKVDRATRAVRVHELLALVGLPESGPRRVHELSGGEQQRVALARALAPAPRLMMLDEPLASIDRERREQLTRDLERIIRTSGVPTLLVTHDLDEAFTLADRVVVLDEGRVRDDGPAERVWRAPATPAVARFLGVVNGFAVPVAGGRAETPLGPVDVAAGVVSVWVGWRPTDLHLDPGGPLAGIVTACWFRRGRYAVEVLTDVGTVVATASTRPTIAARVGIRAAPGAAVITAA